MYDYMTDEELQKIIADVLRDEEKWVPKLNWIDMKTSWEDIERQLEAHEQKRVSPLRLSTSNAMFQLRKLTNMTKNMRYYIFGKDWCKK
ncbi:MAG: hypothetical protein GC192_15410 [Bacteroidetes bacterium]|nr:hypothetical protein [Bacteroidota bacterium]